MEGAETKELQNENEAVMTSLNDSRWCQNMYILQPLKFTTLQDKLKLALFEY